MKLEDLDPENNQAVFDYVINHLVKQGKAATVEDGLMCRYRGPGNTSCAVGCLIPDEDYDPNFENKSVGVERGNSISAYCRRRGFNLDLLSDLQMLHDSTLKAHGVGRDFWKDVERVARYNGLSLDNIATLR